MKQQTDKLYREIDGNLGKRLTNQTTADATGLWFAAVAVCAFLTAGIIVYRTGSSDFVVTAANNIVPPAAKSGAMEIAPIMPQH